MNTPPRSLAAGPLAVGALVSGAGRPLRLRKRWDLLVQQQVYQGRQYWVVKDPLTLKYYRFEEEEFALLELLDGSASLEGIQQQFETRFAPQKISLLELHQLVGMLYRSGLATADAPGQGAALLERGRRQQRQKLWSTLANVLCIRLRGFDPDRLLTGLNRRVGWLFSWPAFTAAVALALGALLLVVTQFAEFQARLPSFQEFAASRNWLWLAAALAGTKVLHEFGHGLACKRFGGECHEMGAMLLVLTPCLYCNVSDSWMIPDKWRRAAIGAAGMYVELILASLCTFGWWFTQPASPLHYLCLNVMFVCSVSTLLFNANPLLRYDGYYILSDLLEIPNLRQKASTILRRKLAKHALGLREPADPFLPHRRQAAFAAFSVASTVYQWIVTATILWFLYHVFQPHGFQVVGQALAIVVIGGMIAQPAWQLSKFWGTPGRIDQVSKPRLLVSLAGAAGLLLAVFLLPTPHYVRCEFVVQPRDAASVYVDAAGELAEILVRAGDVVDGGQPLVTLRDIDTEISLQKLASQLEQLTAKLDGLERQQFHDDSVTIEIAAVRESILSLEEQLTRQQRLLQRLRIVSPAPGEVIPAAVVPRPPAESNMLAAWSGTPLDPHNVSAFLRDGTLVCRIGDPSRLEAVLAIDQSAIEFVQAGQTAELFPTPLPGVVVRGPLRQIARMEMRHAPRGLSAKSGGGLATRADGQGGERPLSTTYQASVPFDDREGQQLIGATGQAKIFTGYQTTATRVWRLVCSTFDFEV